MSTLVLTEICAKLLFLMDWFSENLPISMVYIKNQSDFHFLLMSLALLLPWEGDSLFKSNTCTENLKKKITDCLSKLLFSFSYFMAMIFTIIVKRWVIIITRGLKSECGL